MWEWRPMDWDKEGSPGSVTWQQILKDRAAAKYQPGMKMFGYAEVRERRAASAPQQNAGSQQYQPGPTTTESMVQHAADTAPDQQYNPGGAAGQQGQQYVPTDPAAGQSGMVY